MEEQAEFMIECLQQLKKRPAKRDEEDHELGNVYEWPVWPAMAFHTGGDGEEK
jgi:hypothetical protein